MAGSPFRSRLTQPGIEGSALVSGDSAMRMPMMRSARWKVGLLLGRRGTEAADVKSGFKRSPAVPQPRLVHRISRSRRGEDEMCDGVMR